MLQINLPPEMRCDQIDAREREHWVSALADPDMKRKETNEERIKPKRVDTLGKPEDSGNPDRTEEAEQE